MKKPEARILKLSHLSFENGSVYGFGAVLLEDGNHFAEHVFADGHLIGLVVPRSLGRFEHQFASRGRLIAQFEF